MARLVGKERADLRAMEHQANDPRTNPVRGAGATPSMGLSQFRGGAVPDIMSAAPIRMVGGVKPRRKFAKNEIVSAVDNRVKGRTIFGVDGNDLANLTKRLPQQRALEDLASVNANDMRKARSGRGYGGDECDGGAHHGESASRMADATAMGLHLGQHLHSLHGAGFFSKFKKGFAKVGKTLKKGFDKALPVIEKVNAFREKHIEPLVRKALPYLGPKGAMLESALKGKDALKNLTSMLPEGDVKRGIKAVGFGGGMYPSGAYEGQGRESDDIATIAAGSKNMDKKLAKHAKAHPPKVEGGKKRRAPAGASDGRKKRAEIVKKVMREQGLKMIEASKYVKAHNLY